MIRKQIVIDGDLDRRLAERAEASGASQSQLVRNALESYLARGEADARAEALGRFLGDAESVRATGIHLPALSREELHERAVLHRFERGDLPVRREGDD